MNNRNKMAFFPLLLLFLSCPLSAETRMIFPRVVFQQNRWLGIAVVNPTNAPAQVTLTAYNMDGSKFAGAGVTNDVADTVGVGSQYLKLATQIFNPPSSMITSTTPTRLWVELTSPTDGLTGFYLEGDDQFTFMDGSSLSGNGTDLILPLVENTGTSTTELSLVNPNSTDANLTLTFIDAAGDVVSTQSAKVPASGGLQGPLGDLFNISYASVAGLSVHSDVPIACYASIFRNSYTKLVTIAAQDTTTPARTLYFPQLAVGADWSTALGIVNLDSSQNTLVTITAYQPDGTLFTAPSVQNNPVSQQIPPSGIFRSDLASLFGFSTSSLQTGWVKVEASSSSINGYVEYGSASDQAVVAAQLHPTQVAMFSHQANGSGYYTGLAVLNPTSLTTNVQVFSLAGDGHTYGSTQHVLKPGQKEALLIPQWVTSAEDKTGGSVFVSADHPVIATQLYGTSNGIALANVPPQEITTSFSPTPTSTPITTSPALAVVETGKTRQFSAAGASGVTWWVNGSQGGDSADGTISGSGLYTAPGLAPLPHSLALEARTSTIAGGSSVDVVQRETLVSGLTLVTSVAYLQNLNAFFVAEQQILSSAPSGRQAATTTNTKISQVLSGGTTSAFVTVPNDTIAKMIPFVDGANTYLLLAGVDSGKVYRLNAVTKQIATVISGLNKPNSLALDSVTGNLLVAESGANQITVVSRSQILAASAPLGAGEATASSPSPDALSLPVASPPLGVAIDNCNGYIYYVLSNGELHEIKGSRDRTVVAGLDRPRQLQPLYRQGLPCSDGLALAVVEATGITLVFPKTNTIVPFLGAFQNALDVTFILPGNPFIRNGEAAIALGDGPPGNLASTVYDIPVGGLWSSVPPDTVATVSQTGTNTVPFQDPEGDTFATASSTGLQVPDILSINGFVLDPSSVITIQFRQPPVLGVPGSNAGLRGFIYLQAGAGGDLTREISQYFPLGVPGLRADTKIDIAQGILTQPYVFPNPGNVSVQVSVLGNTLTITIPARILNISRAAMIIVVGNSAEMTDIAPNQGYIQLSP